uniref:Uncharacterized protein n=1 Tax=Oryza meridionalis TaxID=40149 RepID=A0A0E0CAS0_9ORYZ
MGGDGYFSVGLLRWSEAVEQQKLSSTLVVQFCGVTLTTPLLKSEDLRLFGTARGLITDLFSISCT